MAKIKFITDSASDITFDNEIQFNKQDVGSLSKIKTCLQFQRKAFSELAA